MNLRIRTVLLAGIVIALVGITGCLGAVTDGGDPETATAGAADVQLSSIGQTPTDDGTAIEVSAIVTNQGSETANVSATVELLNGSEPIAERTVALGDLGPDESASFSLTFDVDPDRVDGRQITFD